MDEKPYVSIVIPCRNEEKFIGKCIDSVIVNDYPKDRLEALVVDGMSEDETREIVARYGERYPFIRLLDNPKKITPCAFNMGIKHAKGDIIMIMSAHAAYEKDYISKCVRYLKEYNADNVGGAMITLPTDNTFIGRAVVNVLSHPFGVGGSVFRTGSKGPKWVDTVFGGCYKKEVFGKMGLFNENLESTQDMEFNLRLKRAGGKILLVPEIVSHYYTRSSFKAFCKNNFRNGVWAIYPLKFVRVPLAWRHYIPLVFVLSLMGSIALSFLFPIFLWLLFFIAGSYFLANFYFSCKIAFCKRDFRYLFIMLVVFAAFHIGYGLGSIWGAIKLLFPVKKKRLFQDS